MNYEGETIRCQSLEDGVVELIFDAREGPVNKFDRKTLSELREVANQLKGDMSIKGLLVSSAKSVFIVGADISEFSDYFSSSEDEIVAWLKTTNAIFCDLEDLDFPSVTAFNGYALGGGLEMGLATTYRIMSTKAKVGQPEVKLGVIPGFGGTVRLPRVIGADNAIEWIAGGKEYNAVAAFRNGVVEAVVEPEKLREAALHLLRQAISGKLDWKAKRQEKLAPLTLDPMEGLMVFEGGKIFVSGEAGPHYPAPLKAVEVMQAAAPHSRDKALTLEHQSFSKLAKTTVAANLVSLFLNDQYLKKSANNYQKSTVPIQSAAVLGAGIMGAGIAYQSAYRGIPVVMKDVDAEAAKVGLSEAASLLNKQISRGRIDTWKMTSILNRIRTTLSYEDIKFADIIVEAVVENLELKKKVLTEVESRMKSGAILTTNTSTLSITMLAEGLKRPESFCGMHFFNPVHRMPLVEVVRGKKTGKHAITQAVGYAISLGKSPLVVNDCPGFLINRILAAYFAGFMGLLAQGVDFKRIDKVMEKFGWPMGPAHLLDVIGLDTAAHVEEVMARGFPERMKNRAKSAVFVLNENKRFGQKNRKGFYLYSAGLKGKTGPDKKPDPLVEALLQSLVINKMEVSDDEIVERMMIPMIIESSRCLEDQIVLTPQEVDMGCIYGLGFPPFRGGLLKYADSFGLQSLCEKAQRYTTDNPLYVPTEQIRALARDSKGFYA